MCSLHSFAPELRGFLKKLFGSFKNYSYFTTSHKHTFAKYIYGEMITVKLTI